MVAAILSLYVSKLYIFPCFLENPDFMILSLHIIYIYMNIKTVKNTELLNKMHDNYYAFYLFINSYRCIVYTIRRNN